MRLMRPRLLPATIAAMVALLVVKSALLVEAAAGETGALAPTQPPASSPAPALLPPATSAPSKPEGGDSTRQAASPAAGLAMSDSERTALLGLRKRRAELDARTHALDEREAELSAANHRLEERVTELSTLQTRLEGLESGRRQHQAENWAGLVKTYEAMKPREAAAIFDVLDMQVLLQVLDRMQERKAAQVLAAMQPDRARLATQLLAELRTRAITPSEGIALQPASSLPAPKG